MKRKNLVFSIVIMGLAGMFIISCEKSNTPVNTLTSEDIVLAQDDATADDIYSEIDAAVLEKIIDLESSNYQEITEKSGTDDYSCLTITVDYPDSTRFPKVITLDYGEGCTVYYPNDTITKKGKVIITLTDRCFVIGSQHIVTFEDFYVNNVKVEGTLTSTYNGINSNDLLEYSIQLEGGKLIYYDDSTGTSYEYTRESDLLKEWYRAPVPVEDSIYLSGSMCGVNVFWENYTCTITNKLTLAHCTDYGRRWVIVDGQIVCVTGDEERVIDYSDGGCDGTAVVRGDGERFRIRIRELHRNRNHAGNRSQ